jgi:hypothetical protein
MVIQLWEVWDTRPDVLDFKLLPRSECCMLSWRLNFIRQHFKTLCLFHLHRRVGEGVHLPFYKDRTDSVSKRWHIKFRCRGITHKKSYNKTRCALKLKEECQFNMYSKVT